MDYRLYQLEFIVGLSYISNGVLKKNLLSSIYAVCNLPSKYGMMMNGKNDNAILQDDDNNIELNSFFIAFQQI